jgi:hypothetical protein
VLAHAATNGNKPIFTVENAFTCRVETRAGNGTQEHYLYNVVLVDNKAIWDIFIRCNV